MIAMVITAKHSTQRFGHVLVEDSLARWWLVVGQYGLLPRPRELLGCNVPSRSPVSFRTAVELASAKDWSIRGQPAVGAQVGSEGSFEGLTGPDL